MGNEYSDLTNSDADNEELLHYHFGETYWFQGVHQTTGMVLNKNFVFNQTFGKSTGEVLFQ